MKNLTEKLNEIEQGKIWEIQKRYVLFTDEITKIIRDTVRDAKDAVINQIKQGEICLNCGGDKESKLSDLCGDCLENE